MWYTDKKLLSSAMIRLVVFAAVAGALSVEGAAISAATPPRGWNSYDSYTWKVSESDFLANCAAMKASGLVGKGYEYCVVDYLWFMDLNATATDGSPWAPGEDVSPSSLHIDAHGRPVGRRWAAERSPIKKRRRRGKNRRW